MRILFVCMGSKMCAALHAERRRLRRRSPDLSSGDLQFGHFSPVVSSAEALPVTTFSAVRIGLNWHLGQRHTPGT